MKQRSEQVKIASSVEYRRCLQCGKERVAYADSPLKCIFCQNDQFSQPIILSYIRNTMCEIGKLESNKHVPKGELAERKAILFARYQQASPFVAKKANEIFDKVTKRFLDGDLSDRCLDNMVFCFHLFSELGLHDAAVKCALMIGSAYFTRAQSKEIRTLVDLADLAAARQWFADLGQHEWVATVDLMVGLKAGHTVISDLRDKYLLLQISRVHLSRSYQYYADKDLPLVRQRVEKETEWVNDLLGHAMEAVSRIEAAVINGKSRIKAAEIVGESLAGLADSITDGFAQLSLSMEKGLDGLGQRIEATGGRVSDAIRASAFMIGTSVVQHGELTRKGFKELGEEVGSSLEAAGDKACKAMGGLGTKMAVGMLGAGSINALIMDGTLRQLADTVTPQIQQGLANLKLIESEVKAPATIDVADIKDALISKGLDEVNSRINVAGLEVSRV